MLRTVSHLLVITALGVGSAVANPISLSEAWQASRSHDPTYQAAISEREAGQAERAIGRAGLLPQVSGNIGRTRMRGDIDTPDAQGNVINHDLHYTSKINEINAQQMVFDWDAISAYRQGHAKADKALATFDTHVNESSERLINRYFQLLLAHQNALIAQSNLDDTAQHVNIAQRHFDSGEGTITAVHDAQSRHDMAQARRLVAADELTIARRELQEMIGSDPNQVYTLKAELSHQHLQPTDLDAWMEMAMQRNAQIREAAAEVDVNSLEVQRAFSGHLPSVSLTGSVRKTEGETLSTREQKASTRSIGGQISIPIYSGGRTHAEHQQAKYYRDGSQYEHDAIREDIAVEVTRQYQGVISGVKQVEAYQQAVESNQLAVNAAERSYQGGTSSIRDILDAQERLYQAELDLTKARLDYVLARLMLAAVADGLNGDLIEQTSHQFFSSQPIQISRF